jgi:signal transduction histidine kinase/predicted CoA-binding protein
MSESYSFFRKVPLFAELTDEDLERICEHVEEVHLRSGEQLFEEGSIGQQAFVIKEGQIEIYKVTNGRNVTIAVRKEGEMIGEIGLLESAPRSASGKALTDSLLLAISQEQFDQLINTSPSAARTMLHTVISRLRSKELILNQSEKMAQLGTLSAGIAHELNNPASAVQRGAGQFKSAFAQYQSDAVNLSALGLSQEQFQALQALALPDVERETRKLSPVDRNDQESAFEEWLDDMGIDNSWEQSVHLVNLGYSPEQLKQSLASYPSESLLGIIRWITSSYNLFTIMEEITQGAGRISEIVKALKSYVYLDQVPVQTINIHEGIENTLVILRYKLKKGIDIIREYDPDIPPIQAYGSELNQVWTNIIDNAIDAMDGKGKITIHTAYKDPWVVVDICDNGPGIPEEIQSRLFSPFFTTKPLGKGTGLGLHITYNIIHKHGGDIKVISQPGDTHFEVWLPEDLQKATEGTTTLHTIHRSDDNSLRQILANTRTIAVVGITDRDDAPAFTVPAYLQRQGYRILPVNPRITTVLGEKAYPDLVSVPTQVDTVLIFRKSEFVPRIVDQAIQIGAKVVWMQEGIINEAAALKASQAGLEVVMDTCMRSTHRRLSTTKTEEKSTDKNNKG